MIDTKEYIEQLTFIGKIKFAIVTLISAIIIVMFKNFKWFRKLFKEHIKHSRFGWILMLHFMFSDNRTMAYELYGDELKDIENGKEEKS